MAEIVPPPVSLGEILKHEPLLRDLLLFGILFSTLLFQGWDQILLPLFSIFVFFEIIFLRALLAGERLNYAGYKTPLSAVGLDSSVVNRVELAGIVVLLAQIIQGYDSLARPQLSATLSPYFFEIVLAFYILGHYWVLPSPGQHSPGEGTAFKRSEKHSAGLAQTGKVLGYASLFYLVLFFIGTLFNLLTAAAVTPALYLLNLPGSTLTHGTQFAFSGAFLIILVMPPAYTAIALAQIAKGLVPQGPHEVP